MMLLLLLLQQQQSAMSFSSPIFQGQAQQAPLTFPSKTDGVEIELPDFDELFSRLQLVSPLAKIAIQQSSAITDGKTSHFDNMKDDDSLKWTILHANKNALVHHIDKIDNFQNLNCPILRFRSKLSGPCAGEVFAGFIMNVDQREQWDPAIEQVYEAYPVADLDVANVLMGFGKYGDCRRLGVGYCSTKSYLAVSGREQLTLCGIQNFPDGSTVIWGTEMEDWHNHLLPTREKRLQRSRSHLFSTTLVPTGPDTFDVEYCLQIDIGGKLPGWITTPILVETVKSMFRYGQEYFIKEQDNFMADLKNMESHMEERSGILMTP